MELWRTPEKNTNGLMPARLANINVYSYSYICICDLILENRPYSVFREIPILRIKRIVAF